MSPTQMATSCLSRAQFLNRVHGFGAGSVAGPGGQASPGMLEKSHEAHCAVHEDRAKRAGPSEESAERGVLGGFEALFHQRGSQRAESAHLRDAHRAGAAAKAPGDLRVLQPFDETQLDHLALAFCERGE